MSPAYSSVRTMDHISEVTRAYRLSLRLRGVTMESGVIIKTPSRLHFGHGVTLQYGTIIHCGGRAWSNGQGHVTLGNHVVVGPYCALYGAGGIILDDYVHLGPMVKIMSQAGQHSPSRLSTQPDFKLAPVHIGRGGWIGAGAVILGGASLGVCVTVSPNSVVSGSVPDYAIVVGNPGRVILLDKSI